MPPDLMLESLAPAAVAVVFVRGSIFAPVRTWGPSWWRELTSCVLCSGWWVGAAWTLMGVKADSGAWAPFSGPFGAQVDVALRVMGGGALAACAALLFVRVIDRLETDP